MAENTTDASALLPGLPHELALLCFSKLPIDAVARCRAVSHSWAAALLQYPAASRLRQALVYFCVGHVNVDRESSMAWLLFFPSDLGCRTVPFFNMKLAHKGIHIYSSQMQVITTGTNLLLVRSRLTFTREPKIGICDTIQCDDDQKQPGALQGFDLWQMKWCREAGYGMHVPPMHVDRWGFATAHVGEHAYVAGGGGDSKATRSAERLNIKTGRWEMLPEMIKERSVHPAGFAMGGCFYVVGGEFQPTTATAGLIQTGEFYDPEKAMWTLVPGIWPEEMWGFGWAPYVVVVKDEAYAIGDRSQVMRLRVKGGWEIAGRLPNVREFKSAEQWFFRLVSVGEDELWVVLFNMDEQCPWLVFSCKPYLSMDGLSWERLSLTIPSSPRQGIVTFNAINI